MKMLVSGVMCAALLLCSGAAFAQPDGQEGAPPLGPGEVQRLLDGYAIVQAQQFLGMDDAQFAAFLPKLRGLQETRRRHDMERLRLLQELRRLTNPRAQGGEPEIRERIRALRELDTRSAADVQRAYESIDQSLDVRQQARFRLFEQEIEQRKLQLLMRARQQNRAGRAGAPP